MRSGRRIVSMTLLVGATLGLLAGCGSSSGPSRPGGRRTNAPPPRPAARPPVKPVPASPANQIFAKCQEMKQVGAAKNLAGVQRLLDECLALDRNYAGDAYVSAGAGLSAYINATNPAGAEKASLYQKKLEYFQKAKAAYQASGARTNRGAEIPKLVELCDRSIDMAQQELKGP